MQFSTPELSEIFGLDRNRVQGWLKAGWITPSIQQAKGTGTRNVFSLEDAYIFGVFVQFVLLGYDLGDAAVLTSAVEDKGVSYYASKGTKFIYDSHKYPAGKMSGMGGSISSRTAEEALRLSAVNIAEVKRVVDEWARVNK